MRILVGRSVFIRMCDTRESECVRVLVQGNGTVITTPELKIVLVSAHLKCPLIVTIPQACFQRVVDFQFTCN